MLWNIGSGVGRIVSPPAILLLLIGVGLWHVRKQWGVRLAWSALIVLWALSTPLVGYTLLDAFTQSAVPVDAAALPKDHAIIVVLPAGKVRAAEYPGGETASPLTVQRLRYGVSLSKASGLPLAIPGGKHRGVFSEAELARRFVEHELNHRVLLTEHMSLDTRQSALNLIAPLRENGVRTVVLVTDARHMPRAAQAFAAVGVDVIRAPMAITSGESHLSPLAFFPSAPALVASFEVSHEVIGRVWYRIRALVGGGR